ncbi:MAG: thioredoxin domain-containing protein [Flavobacteriales bacterium]
MPPSSNRLAQERSPYLLQHARNPVDWYPWGEEAFAKARAEDKLVLVSIGYSSCHWCHVMERECFEDATVAQLMNERFVCIKVDREERPDVDHVYMDAVQMLTRRGGWPLNCFTLPDGRPVHGGTYFPKAQWMQLLAGLDDLWRRERQRVIDQATDLHEGLRATALIDPAQAPGAFRPRDVQLLADRMAEHFDRVDGGADRAPKFPLPDSHLFLLRQAFLTEDAELKAQVRLTLDRMAWGGLFDQVGGGFARYSVDAQWKVPHFEKMLYDNAQLISLYARGFQAFGDTAYRDVVERTIAFAQRELMAPDGGFFCALDADSEGEEGRFYTWTMAELERILGPDLPFAIAYYNVNERGLWEQGRYILLRTRNDAAFAAEHGMPEVMVRQRAVRVNAALLTARAERVRPGLDHKVLTGWNAMMVRALCDAFEVLGDQAFLDMAERAMRLILSSARRTDGGLWRTRTNGEPAINGQLEDHAFTIDALLALYGVTFEEHWLEEARSFTAYVHEHFLDKASGLFHSTSDLDPPLITRPLEVLDSVMPSANAVMARNLYTLGTLFEERAWTDAATHALRTVQPRMPDWPDGYTHWAQLMQALAHPLSQIAIIGTRALEERAAFGRHYIPQCLFLGTTGTSSLPLLAEKHTASTSIFVCVDNVCGLPVTNVDEALRQL